MEERDVREIAGSALIVSTMGLESSTICLESRSTMYLESSTVQ